MTFTEAHRLAHAARTAAGPWGDPGHALENVLAANGYGLNRWLYDWTRLTLNQIASFIMDNAEEIPA